MWLTPGVCIQNTPRGQEMRKNSHSRSYTCSNFCQGETPPIAKAVKLRRVTTTLTPALFPAREYAVASGGKGSNAIYRRLTPLSLGLVELHGYMHRLKHFEQVIVRVEDGDGCT